MKYFLIFFLILHALGAQAGHDDTTAVKIDFSAQVKDILDRTKLDAAMGMASEFLNYWSNGSLSSTSKISIDSIGSLMLDRRLPANPYFINFIRLVNGMASGKLSPDKTDKLLPLIEKSMRDQDNAEFNRMLVSLNDFIETQALYYSRYYRLYAHSGDFDFEYIENPFALTSARASGNKSASPDSSLTTGIAWGTSAPLDTSRGWDRNPAGSGSSWGDSSWNQNASIPGMKAGQDASSSTAIGAASLPPESGLNVKFTSTDLIFVTPFDSVPIHSTSGSWGVNGNYFLGNGGSFDWVVAGYQTGEITTQFDKYYIQVDHPAIAAENVKLMDAGRLEKPVEGIFNYANIPPDRSGAILYPAFIAYSSDHKIIYPEDESVSLTGGFSITGKMISTKSLYKGNTRVEIKNGNKVRLRATGSVFQIRDSLLYSPNTSLTVYQGKDSIYHPAVKFYYYPKTKNLLAEKNAGEDRLTPFLASYYKLEVDADALQWDLSSDSLYIFNSMARNIVPANFKSYDYFNQEGLESLSRAFRFNPLIIAVNYARKTGINNFNADDLASFYKLNPATVRASMKALKQNNFVAYDDETHQVAIRDKAFNFIDANKGRKDYDDMVVSSVSGAAKNATVNLSDNDLQIRGVDKFDISKALDVFIYPDSNTVSVMNNRNMKFNGRLMAGNFEFVGRDFLFKYDSFYVDMTHIDSIRFFITDPKTGRKRMVDNKLVSIDTAKAGAIGDLSGGLNKTSGRLFINMPDNKSGRKIYPGYPSFDAAKGAIVYFNNQDVLHGAYDQSVYFVIPPFKIDSLNNSDPSTIGFEGKFYSGGMLPPFNETLHVMADNSLGFDHDIAPEGYNVYGGNGKIYNHLRLDKKGISASGKIQYLTSSLNSGHLTFYLDSLTGRGRGFKMDAGDLAGGSFPDAAIDTFRLKWLPKQDSMYVFNIGKPFSLYNQTASLNGMLNVNHLGAFGRGELDTRKSLTQSDNLFFNQTKFEARHARFRIQSNDPDKPILSGDDIRLFFNLNENYADIGPEIEGMAAIDFPYAQFRTSIPTARWNLQNRTVEMRKPDNINISSSYFYATRKDLDSLAFNATSASYNIDTYQLLIKGIPYIKVADARITPENNQVLVLENAKIGTLKNTNIVIDTLTAYHSLYNGTIDIVSRNKFEGSATYRFVNAVKDTFAIKIDQFELVPDKSKGKEASLHTQASGFINDMDKVVISPGMVYKGKATMYAPDPAFALDGYIKLQYRPNPGKDIWIKYQSSETSTQEVQLDFKSARSEDNEPLIAGIHYDQNNQLYTTFVNDKKSVLDADFFTPDGLLYYDADSSSYRIDDTAKVDGNSFKGEIFDLNVKTNKLNFEGSVNFNLKASNLQVTSAGIGEGNILNNRFSLDGFFTINYDIPSAAFDAMTADILKASEGLGLPSGYENDPSLLYKVAEIIGEKATEDFEQRSLKAYVPLITVSPQLDRSIVLATVNLVYDDKNRAWYSIGKIGISNMGHQDVNLMVDGFMEIRKSDTGDILNLFLQISPDTWYYFNFEDNRLLLASTNPAFNDIIKGKSTALKANFGAYFFLNGEAKDVITFINQFRKQYLGLTEPYDLKSMPSSSTEETPVEKKPENENNKQKGAVKKQAKQDDEGF